MATIYKTSGECIKIAPENGSDFSLSELQAIVSGYIEIINLFDGRIMVVNDEGKLNGLAINHVATQIFNEAFPITFDVVVGDVLVCANDEVK